MVVEISKNKINLDHKWEIDGVIGVILSVVLTVPELII